MLLSSVVPSHIERQVYGNLLTQVSFKLRMGNDQCVVVCINRIDDTAQLWIKFLGVGSVSSELMQCAVDSAMEQVCHKWQCTACFHQTLLTAQMLELYARDTGDTQVHTMPLFVHA